MDNSVCFEKFKDYLTNVKKASSNTLSSYLRDIRQFGEYLDSHETVGYTEADEEVLNGYISWLRGMGKSVATVSRSIASLKCFYTFLILQRIVSENPTGKLVPDKCEQKLPQILTSSEVELLLEQPECTDFKGYRDKAMLELLSDRRQKTVANLMPEFGVSRCTVLRDIETLSCSAPIFTVQENGGGVRVADGYYYGRRYLHSDQEALLRKLMPGLQPNEQKTMQSILNSFGMPKVPA